MLLWSRWFSFMAHSMTVLFLLLCSQLVVGGVVTSARGNTSTLSCRNISAGDVYTCPVPSYIPSAVLWNKDCEQEWYNEAGEFLSDGHHHANKTRHRLVVEESSENITLSKCVKLHYYVTCHGSSQKFKHTYQVINDTTLSFEQQSDSSTTTNTTIISVVIPLIVGLHYIFKKKVVKC
ncbi:uncharacterized protein LOC128615344 [Ictalurus furcatus]|uniref:uncharacterized protein LOC128615344 n=1 Tax=Ictalurus furcatus TaxID=66913 RepID=UPI0023506A16|nr:uncharacterized protein LOC128615344 [Ictalurus furcatus]XP_053493310.1 uncharacterized protein LOC128615344 [Ictalurus furcatus]XP_053493311.1 uncharacterized protein LOC128615344 [Ictalurus furcatus]XP_053493312.1 uncharacterized protein LOC128615344 [Ictalurus furcatus]XP_053493313.1 uncharacterized protein LOC128615344 [Ictalurus furcatus]